MRLLKSSTGEILLFAVAISFFLSCEEAKVDNSFFKDKWLIVEAARNGSPTSTLEDGFFHILSDTTLSTNIFGQEETYPVVINNEEWLQETPESIQYEVEVRHDDSLTIACEIRGLAFRFLLARDTTVIDQ